MKKNLLCIAVSAAVMLQTSAFAATADISRNFETNRYIVTGTAPEADDYIVSCFVGDSETNVYVMTAVTDEEGNFSFEFGLRDDVATDEYELKLMTRDGLETYEDVISIYANEDVKDAISAAVGATNGTELKGILGNEDTQKILGLDIFCVHPISDDSVISLTNALAGKMTEENFYNKYMTAYSVYALNDADIADYGETIADYEKYLLLDELKTKPLFDKVVDKQKLYKLAKDYDATDIDALRKAITEATLLACMSEAMYQGEIMEVLEKYEDCFPFELTAYNSSTNKTGIAINLLNSKTAYNSMDDFEDELKKFAGTKNPGGSGGIGGSTGGSSGGGLGIGGGSGSSSGGSFAVDAPIVEEKLFTDIDGFEWAQESIDYLAEMQIVNGYEDGSFRPGNNITREEFVKMVVSAFGYYNEAAECEFVDVADSSWAYRYVASAFESEIVKGVSETEFGFGNLLSRQDMAVIICNAMKLEDGSDIAEFADNADIADYAINAVYALKKAGIVNGFEDNTYMPKNYATRAEVSKIIFECLSRGGF